MKQKWIPANNVAFVFFIWKRGRGVGMIRIILTPVNKVAFVLCIWKVEHSPKQKIIPTNNVTFVLCIWKGGIHYLIPYLYTTSRNSCHFYTWHQVSIYLTCYHTWSTEIQSDMINSQYETFQATTVTFYVTSVYDSLWYIQICLVSQKKEMKRKKYSTAGTNQNQGPKL